uniref:Glycosyltransferase n=1 Tax=Chenopodium quinoa TaxID=63459 RepID=A0A803L010_CHEQI
MKLINEETTTQGHLRPFLHLAHRLLSLTPFNLSLLTTPLNAANLRRQSDNFNINLNIIELPFTSTDHGLPPNTENTDKLSLTSIIKLFHASTSLEPHVRDYLTRHHLHDPPVCIIFDVFLGWADNVARSVGSTGICFNTGGAYGVGAYVSIWSNLPHRNVGDDEEFSLAGFPEDRKLRRNQLHRFLRFADGSDEWSRFFQPQIKSSLNCSGWLCNSIEEIEPLGFQVFRNFTKSPIWGIGPLIMTSSKKDDDEKEEACLRWLNQFENDSVLYICFGSQNTVTPIQMMELAKGLEESKIPFLWVIRPPFGFDFNGEFKPEWLPEKFEERMMEKKQGMLVRDWVPQLDILRHEATGGFLSHCGWNSVLEGLREGVPILGWPLAAEQAYNSKMMVEEMGVAVELTRGLEGEVKKEWVKSVVEMVLDRKEGSCGWEMKKKAVEIGEKLKDAWKIEGDYKGSSVKAMDNFVEFIVSCRGKKSKEDA